MLCAGPTNTGNVPLCKDSTLEVTKQYKSRNDVPHKNRTTHGRNDGSLCMGWAIVRILASVQQGDD